MLCRMINRYSRLLRRELCETYPQDHIPLHPAVKYNLIQVTQCIVNHMVDYSLYVRGHNHSATLQQDSVGITPLKWQCLRVTPL